MFKTEHRAEISQAVSAGSDDLNEKINLLSENVQSLLDRNDTINAEIETVKSDFQEAIQGLTTQMIQINVSSTC